MMTVVDSEVRHHDSTTYSHHMESMRHLLSQVYSQCQQQQDQLAAESLQATLTILDSLADVVKDEENNIRDTVSSFYGQPLTAEGFLALSSFLSRVASSSLIHSTVPRLVIQSLPNNKICAFSSICFEYVNNPIEGWYKAVCLQIEETVTSPSSNFDIFYLTPSRLRKFGRMSELEAYAEQQGMARGFLDQFDFRQVFCICQTPYSARRQYLKCSFGKCGCNSWMHPECVGLGDSSIEELRKMDLVCPFCTSYLEGLSTSARSPPETRFLHQAPLNQTSQETLFNGLRIKETSVLHRVWGLEDNRVSHVVPSVLPSTTECKRNDAKQNKKLVDREENFEEDVPIAKRRRMVTYGDGSKVAVGLQGGYLACQTSQTSKYLLLPLRERPIYSSSQSIQYHDFMELTHVAMRGYRQGPGRPSSRKSIQASEAPRSGNVVSLCVGLHDGGIRGCSLNIVGQTNASMIDKLCSDGIFCGYCMVPLRPADSDKSDVKLPAGDHNYSYHPHCALVVRELIQHREGRYWSLISSSLFPSRKEWNFIGLEHKEEDEVQLTDEGDGSCPVDSTLRDLKAVCSFCSHPGGLLLRMEFVSNAHEDEVGSRSSNQILLCHPVCARLCSGSEDSSCLLQQRLFWPHDVAGQPSRCALCGKVEGIVWRCVHKGCATHSHPICAHLQDDGSGVTPHAGWSIISIESAQHTEHDENGAYGVLCPLHSGL
eukprot:scaffold3595_cov235-Ochromonas_danica.AAC.2